MSINSRKEVKKIAQDLNSIQRRLNDIAEQGHLGVDRYNNYSKKIPKLKTSKNKLVLRNGEVVKRKNSTKATRVKAFYDILKVSYKDSKAADIKEAAEGAYDIIYEKGVRRPKFKGIKGDRELLKAAGINF